MGKIVLALGGNALGNNPVEQLELVKGTAKSVVDLVEGGNKIVIVHGNGPQVGMINNGFEIASKSDNKVAEMPFPECGAMSQGYIGYHLQNAIKNELNRRNINKEVAAVVSQMVVDQNDAGFKNPTKPIGGYFSKDEADKIASEKGFVMKEDAGRGYRRVVASPKPIEFVETGIIKTLVENDTIVIAAGGGGIPVIKTSNGYEGVPAVIDKDFAAAKLAEIIEADQFFILTAVDRVAINFGKENQEDLAEINLQRLDELISEKHFAPGSMLPKVEACKLFVENNPGKVAIIASLDKASLALKGESGTKIVK